MRKQRSNLTEEMQADDRTQGAASPGVARRGQYGKGKRAGRKGKEKARRERPLFAPAASRVGLSIDGSGTGTGAGTDMNTGTDIDIGTDMNTGTDTAGQGRHSPYLREVDVDLPLHQRVACLLAALQQGPPRQHQPLRFHLLRAAQLTIALLPSRRYRAVASAVVEGGEQLAAQAPDARAGDLVRRVVGVQLDGSERDGSDPSLRPLRRVPLAQDACVVCHRYLRRERRGRV